MQIATQPPTLGLKPKPAMIFGGISEVGLAAAILSLGPVGYWKLDDSTTVALDRTANANHGVHGADVSLNSILGGDGGTYPQYSPTNDESYGTRIPHNANQRIETGSGLTAFAMVQTRSIAFGRSGISGKKDAWRIARYIDGNELTSNLSNGNTARELDTSAQDNLATNTWYPQTYIFRGGETHPELWQDGAEITGGLQSGVGPAYVGAVEDLWISYEYGATSRWDGYIAHFALFPKVLSPAEIASLHAAAAEENWNG